MIRRGEVWVCNLNPPRGREIGKIRPVLIIQADELTSSGTPMVIILPMTTQIYPQFKYWRVSLKGRDRLLKDCQIVIDQLRAIDVARIIEGPLTILTAEEMASVEKSLLAVTGIY